MAIYAADIQINVKNKGDLKKLENRFKQINIAAVSLEKTLKGLGKRNAIKVDTRAAMSAISALEARIRGLNRTVRVDARTSGGGGDSSAGMGAAIPLAAGVFGGGRRGQKQNVKTRDLLDIGQGAMSAHIKQLGQDIKQQQSIVENFGETAKRSQDKYAQAIENVNKHQAKSKKQLKDLDKAIRDQPWAKFTKGLLPSTAAKNLINFGSAYLATNSKINDKIANTNKELVDQATHQKKINEVAQANLKDQEDKLNFRKQILKATEKEQDQTIQRALMSDREIDLHKQINQEKVKGFNAFRQQLEHQKKINGELIAGRQPAETLTKQFESAKKATKDAFNNVLSLRKELANPAPKGGLLTQMGASFGSLAKNKGIGAAAGRGALAAGAMLPGVSPLAVGGFAGAAGGGGMAGGAIGMAVAAAIQGTVALGNFIRQSTIAAAEMKKMELALTAVVSSNLEYNEALKSIDEISNSLLIPQAQVTKSFTRLQAAASASGFEVSDVKDMMKGFSAALVATEGDTRNFNGVMLALGQVMGKGKAAAEELRGQIGERLSVVIPELAASMGVTTKELDKLFEQGKVTVQNIVDLGEHLEKKYGQSAANIIKSSMNAGERLKFAMSELQLALGPIFTDIGAGFQNLATTIIEALTPAIKKIAELMGVTREGAAIKLASLGASEIEQKQAANKVFSKSWIDKDRLKEAAMRDDGLEFLRKHQQSRGKRRLGVTSQDLSAIRALVITQEKMKKFEDILNPTITGTKGKKTGGGDDQGTIQRLANAKKYVDQLKIEKKFLEDRFNFGEEEADLNRRIAEARIQYGDENIEMIEKEIRGNEKLRKELEGRVNIEQDLKELLKDRAQALQDLSNPINQLKEITEAFEDGFSNAMREVIRGTKSVGEAVASMLNRIADAMIQSAADIAASAASSALLKFLTPAITSMFGPKIAPSNIPAVPDVVTKTGFNYDAFASGGYVDRPTNAIVGEGSEGEYIIPESKLASSLSRFQAGHRGSSVVPGGVGNSGGSGGGSGEVTVNYTGPTLNFNGDEYVPRTAVPQIINSAAMAGASAGRANTMRDLKNSRSQRSKLGL